MKQKQAARRELFSFVFKTLTFLWKGTYLLNIVYYLSKKNLNLGVYF